jgi:RNA polymerase sigma-B factor
MSRDATKRSAADDTRRLRTDHLLRQVADEPDEARRLRLVNEVVVINLPVARSIAWRYRGRGCALEDLEQTASMALVRAARDFDPEQGTQFLSYAVPCMSGSVKKYFRDTGWTVRPPRLVQELQQRLETAGQVVDPVSGLKPTTTELAQSLDVDEKDVREALQARGCFTPTSLDLELGETDHTVLGDLLVAPEDGSVHAVEARAVLRPALARLSPTDRSVVTMRFVEERTQQQIADALGTTQPAVSRLLERILDDMHASVTASVVEPAPAA